MALMAPFISWYFFTLSGGDYLGSGLIISIPYIAYIFSTAIFGKLSDIIGSKKVVLISLATYTSSFFIYFLIGDNAFFFFVAYIALNIIISGFNPSFNRLVSLNGNEEKTEKFGRLGAIASLGFLVGSIGVSILIDNISFNIIFLFAGGITFFAFILAIKLKESSVIISKLDSANAVDTNIENDNKSSQNRFKKSILVVLFISFIYMMSNSVYTSFFAIFVEYEMNQPVSWVGIVNTLATLFGIGGTYLVGKIAKQSKRKPLIVFALVLYTLIPFCIYLFADIPLMVFLIYCIPVYSIFFVLLPVLISEYTSESKRGQMMGLISSSQNLGIALGTLGGAFIASFYGFVQPNFLFATFVGFVGVIIGIILFHDPSTKKNQV
jgi:MFS family permease